MTTQLCRCWSIQYSHVYRNLDPIRQSLLNKIQLAFQLKNYRWKGRVVICKKWKISFYWGILSSYFGEQNEKRVAIPFLYNTNASLCFHTVIIYRMHSLHLLEPDKQSQIQIDPIGNNTRAIGRVKLPIERSIVQLYRIYTNKQYYVVLVDVRSQLWW